jgi:hypothetical protein
MCLRRTCDKSGVCVGMRECALAALVLEATIFFHRGDAKTQRTAELLSTEVENAVCQNGFAKTLRRCVLELALSSAKG